jgi:hypothetical protein
MADFEQSQHAALWDGQDRRSRAEPEAKGVKFDATINLGHVLTFVGFMVAGMTAWTTLDKRVTIIEERATMQTIVDKNQDATLNAALLSIKESLGKIESRLDHMADTRRGN